MTESTQPAAAVNPFEYVLHGYKFNRADIEIALFLGYVEADVAVLTMLHDPTAKGEPGFITDEYGIRTRTANLWPDMLKHDGAKTGFPMPGNFHWETIEWLAMLKSVISASSSYRVMELGAGWGPATVAGLVLARLKGITDMHATAVEADPFHVGFLRQHVSDNAIPESAVTIFEAAVGVNDGVADWPDDAGTAVEYGNRPITADGDYLGRSIAKTRPVRIMAVDSLLTTQPQWDLLHIDIQGLEVETLTAAISRLNERVARICVGTHSRKIDGDLVALFIGHGWVMEHEKPTKMTYVPNPKTLEAMTSVDGTQVWRNPRLRPNPAV